MNFVNPSLIGRLNSRAIERADGKVDSFYLWRSYYLNVAISRA